MANFSTLWEKRSQFAHLYCLILDITLKQNKIIIDSAMEDTTIPTEEHSSTQD